MPSGTQEDIRRFVDGFPSDGGVAVQASQPSPAPLADAISQFLNGFPDAPPLPAPPVTPQPSVFEEIGASYSSQPGLEDFLRGEKNLIGMADSIREFMRGFEPTPTFSAEGVSIAPEQPLTPFEQSVQSGQISPYRPSVSEQALEALPLELLKDWALRTVETGKAGWERYREAVPKMTAPITMEDLISPFGISPERTWALAQAALGVSNIPFAPITAAGQPAAEAVGRGARQLFSGLPESVRDYKIPGMGGMTFTDLAAQVGHDATMALIFAAIGKIQLKAADMAKVTAARQAAKAAGLVEETPSRGAATPVEAPAPAPPIHPQAPAKTIPGAPGAPAARTPQAVTVTEPTGTVGRVPTIEAAPQVTPKTGKGPTRIPGLTKAQADQIKAVAKETGTKPEIVRGEVRAAQQVGVSFDDALAQVKSARQAPQVSIEAPPTITPQTGGAPTTIPVAPSVATTRQPQQVTATATAAKSGPPLPAESAPTPVTTSPKPSPQVAKPTSYIARLKKSAENVPQKHRADVISVGTKRLTALEQIQAEGTPDYVKEWGIKLKDEANRPFMNTLAQLESSGNKSIGLKPDKNTTSLGPWRISAPLRKDLGLSDTATLEQQAKAVEGVVTNFRKRYGDDMAAVTTAYWRPATAKAVFPKAKKQPAQPVIAGGAPRGAEVIAEAHDAQTSAPFIEPQLTTRTYGKLADIASEYMIDNKIPFDRSKGRLFEQLRDRLLDEPEKLAPFTRYLKSKGVENPAQVLAEAFGDISGGATSEAARKLAKLSDIMRRLEQASETGVITNDEQIFLSTLKRIDNIRRGLLVTQVATSARNAISQSARVGVEALVDGLEAGIRQSRGLANPHDPGVWGAMEANLSKLLKPGQNREVAARILKAFPKQQERLFGSYLSDIEIRTAGKIGGAVDTVLGGAEKGVEVLNTLNRGQEFIFRRAGFLTKLEQRLKAKGVTTSLDQIDPKTISERDIKAAVEHAMELTFARRPEEGSAAAALVNAVNKLPGATLALPFPRFLVNSMRFLYEHNPTGFLKLLSASERAKIAAGDTRVLSKAVVGSTMLLTAYQIRGSEYAGEKWYEIKVGDKTIDTRPFNPFAAYLFVADVLHKANKGELDKLTAKDVVMGLLSTNLRAGAGLFMLDNVLEAFRGAFAGGPSKASAERFLKQFAGEVASGFLTPLRTVKDVVGQFNEDEVKYRDRRSEPFLGPIKEVIPGVSQGLPESASPTRAETPKREYPLLRQLTGVSIKTKNSIETELDRHGFEFRNILPSQGHPDADQALARVMGSVVERGLGRLVQTDAYKQLDRQTQALILDENLKAIRSALSDVSKQQLSREVLWELYLKNLSPRTRDLLLSRPGMKQRLEGYGLPTP